MHFKKLILVTLLSGGLLLSACQTNQSDSGKTNSSSGGTDITTNTGTTSGGDTSSTATWQEINYATFKSEFESRPECPWNHLDAQYGDEMGMNPDGSLTMFRVVENKINGTWVVDTELTENGGGDLTSNLIATNESIGSMENPPEGYEVTFYKKSNGEGFKYIVNSTQGGKTYKTEMLSDKYFYCIDFADTVNEAPVIECHATWSTVEI